MAGRDIAAAQMYVHCKITKTFFRAAANIRSIRVHRGGLPPPLEKIFMTPPGLFFDPTPVKNFDPWALNSSWPALNTKNLGRRPKFFFTDFDNFLI